MTPDSHDTGTTGGTTGGTGGEAGGGGGGGTGSGGGGGGSGSGGGGGGGGTGSGGGGGAGVIDCPDEDFAPVTLGPDAFDPGSTLIEVTATGQSFACASQVGDHEPCVDAATNGGTGYIEICTAASGSLQILLEEGAHCGFNDCLAVE